MYFGLSEDQMFFQDSIKKYLEEQAAIEIVKKISQGDNNLQQEIHNGLVNLGISGILIPEKYGGLDLNILFATATSQALGFGINPSSFLAPYVLAPLAILEAGSPNQQQELLPKIVNDEIKFGVGLTEFVGAREDAKVLVKNSKINGRSLFVIDTKNATHFIIANSEGNLFIVNAQSENLQINDLITIDRTRNFSEIIFEDADVEVLPLSEKTNKYCSKIANIGRVILAADTLGAAQCMIDKSIAYAMERKQFDRLIGSFQAVKHMCAEMTADIEPCFAMVWHAGHNFDEQSNEPLMMACHTKAHISEIGKSIAKKATEVHGGMGFTDLLGLHFWFKRIGMNRQLLGAPEILRREAAHHQGL